MTTWDTVRILLASLLILWSAVELMTSDEWRAVNGSVFTMNVITVLGILHKTFK